MINAKMGLQALKLRKGTCGQVIRVPTYAEKVGAAPAPKKSEARTDEERCAELVARFYTQRYAAEMPQKTRDAILGYFNKELDFQEMAAECYRISHKMKDGSELAPKDQKAAEKEMKAFFSDMFSKSTIYIVSIADRKENADEKKGEIAPYFADLKEDSGVKGKLWLESYGYTTFMMKKSIPKGVKDEVSSSWNDYVGTKLFQPEDDIVQTVIAVEK